MATDPDRRDTQIVVQTSINIQEIIQRAADESGVSLSQFLINSALEKALTLTNQTATLQLSMKGADALFNAMENPPEANEKLLKTAKHIRSSN